MSEPRADDGPQGFFASAVEGYGRYRATYPDLEVAALAERVGLTARHTAVDVGCGTGQLTFALARHAGRVIGVDPLPGMVAAGRRRAVSAGVTNVDWLVADAEHVASAVAAPVRLVSFAASFHWTDRARVLRALDALVEPDGAVVTIHEDLDGSEQPPWAQALVALQQAYRGPDHEAATAPYTRPQVGHREVLSASPFGDVEALSWTWERELSVDEAVGLQFTYSSSTPARFGDRAAAFAVEARGVLTDLHPEGRVVEAFRTAVLIARRPSAHAAG